ncbi:type I restriction-modification system endonuclease [Maribellus sediminis]|uniref:type I restriction-modification system endonuclease n=1 Tax=Maribellus sediminis TaxID=2696285 RepID=UPI00142F96DA|nr:type I restriction-modification system endonuclease [Maribellus sediminis]
MKSNFSFLANEYPILFNLGQSAENNVHQDPGVTLFKLRLMSEKMVDLIFEVHQLDFPYDNSIFAKLEILKDEGILEQNILSLFHNIRKSGNKAVHEGHVKKESVTGYVLSMFKLSKWFYESYSDEQNSISEIRFHAPEKVDYEAIIKALEKEYQELEAKHNVLLQERDIGKLSQQESAALKDKSTTVARKIEMSESETRRLIDEQLRAAGWEVDTPTINFKLHGSLPEKGKNKAIAEWKVGPKWADYALFIGTELYGLVEAKKYEHDISTDLGQSKIYAEYAEEKEEVALLGKWGDYKAPFLFSTNGRPYLDQLKTKSGIWFLDVREKYNIARSLKGWYSPNGLKQLWEQDLRTANKVLQENSLNFLKDKSGLNLRDYQVDAIAKVEKNLIEKPDVNRMLLAMATGTGKTRTVIGLCYRLIQSNRFKRILFLVDRRILAKQALGNFKDNKLEDLNTFSEIYQVQELTDLIPDKDTRLHFATVQSMVKRLFKEEDEQYGGIQTLSVDSYDCIIVDEAHRGYLLDREMDDEELTFKDQNDYVSKYRKVIDYFDATVIGLTATPALQTTEIFGSPIYTYSYREAVLDGFLIDHEPPYIIKTKLSEAGIVWETGEKPKAYDKETNQIIELEKLEDELAIEIEGFNKMVITENFNRTVIEQLVQLIDPDGDEKSLVFAANDEHADLVVELFKQEYKKIGVDVGDDCIRKITGKSYNPLELVRRYKNEKFPNIAVTVDLLTTGVDVPTISNLVFLRRVKSRILFEQMLGRATRLCPEINKEVFRIYDAVRIYEVLQDYTQMKPVSATPGTTFMQLVEEFEQISSEERLRRQVEQIIAKIQRKKQFLNPENTDKFEYYSDGKTVEGVIHDLTEGKNNNPHGVIKSYKNGFWQFLDELKPAPPVQLVSEHPDEIRGIERGYGQGQKPEDYLDGFKQFIENNLNKIAALTMICQRPKELDRQTLKELYLILDAEGYNIKSLNSAWKDAKNEDIAADIISLVRTLAMGDVLVSHEARIKNAIEKVKRLNGWNTIQLKWIERFEKQLLQENIIKKEDLDKAPFAESGGYKRLNKIFNDELDTVISTLNDELYNIIA